MSSRPSFSSDPQGYYALNLLTQAAMHTRHAATNGREGHPNAMITNHRNGHALETTSQTMMDEYNASMLSSRDLDALAFNNAPQTAQQQYLNETYNIESELAMAHANNLGILNAESYDDGRATSRNTRRSRKAIPELPFGISEHPHIKLDHPLDSGEHESAPKRKKAKIESTSQDGEEEPKGKSRGRPRVSPKDETAADRRRTQIRMAQRAYRNRKESTISTLEKKVQDLTGTNEEMSSIFINLYDFAVGKGLLQREPEFGQQLQATTERFLALARASVDEGLDENQDDSAKTDEAEPGRRSKRLKASPKTSQDSSRLASEPMVSEPSPTYGGYIVSKDGGAPEIDMAYMQEDQYRDDQYKDHQYRARPSDIQVITRPTEDNASFPFDLMDLQQYNVEVPATEDFSQHFLPQSQLPLPKSFAYNELSLSRRLHRISNERALKLITSEDPKAQARVQKCFRFSLMYRTKEDITAALRRIVHASAKDTLQNWKAPFVHVGGSGTHYPLAENDPNWDLMPKFHTGYSVGPFRPEIAEAQEFLDDDMKCLVPGFEGYFFDPNDVEGYLRQRGLEIDPAADFATIELDILGIPDPATPKSTTSDSAASNNSPQTPDSPAEIISPVAEKASDSPGMDFTDSSFKDIGPVARCLTFPLGFTSWDDDNYGNAGGDSMDLLFNTKLPQTAKSNWVGASATAHQNGNKRTVTVDVNVLIHEIINNGVCLGRAPGFKPADVEAALMKAVRAGSGAMA